MYKKSKSYEWNQCKQYTVHTAKYVVRASGARSALGGKLTLKKLSATDQPMRIEASLWLANERLAPPDQAMSYRSPSFQHRPRCGSPSPSWWSWEWSESPWRQSNLSESGENWVENEFSEPFLKRKISCVSLNDISVPLKTYKSVKAERRGYENELHTFWSRKYH